MKTHLGRRPFSAMELHTLFSGYVYGDEKQPREQAKHWHFWLPLLAYYTGGFSDELGSLTLEDVYLGTGTAYLHVHTHGKIKARKIPIHPHLFSCGLHEYVQWLTVHGHQRLLFDLPAKSGRYSEKARIWFSGEGERAGYLQKCALPTVDQHGHKTALSSLRLNFEQQVRISAMQLGSKAGFCYLLGLKEYPQREFADMRLLQKIVRGVRVVNAHTHWQRFCNRH
ncbi:hypothetical protein [Pseudoalteromonas ruthenica]|uniref:hypothetical protein n=1 Tax=Pseudoalteromonas ruthenica TaxID=151081 RepID=UPI001244C430|nr:hypothetical protein [Pseudoalteromonas ruthenica]